MSWVLGSFRATLGIDATGFERGMLNAQGLTQVFGSTFATFVTNPVLGGVAAFSQLTRATASAANEALQYAQDTRRVAQEVGVSVELYQTLREVLEANGVQAERARQGLAFLAKGLGEAATGGGPAVAVLERLGIGIADLEKGEPGVRRLLETVAAMEDAQARAGAAAKLFGDEAGPILANRIRESGGSLAELTQEMEDFGLVVSTRTIGSLNELKDVQGSLEQAFEGLKRTAVTGFLAGFSDEAGLSKDNTRELAKVLRDEIAPAAREAGEAVAELLKFFKGLGDSDVINGLKYVAELLGPIVGGIYEFSTNVNAGAIGAINGTAIQQFRNSGASSDAEIDAVTARIRAARSAR